ncbi:MAG: sulfotransferase [Pseudomonadales bacterium]|nr:sulfotransferase [Pseudomonadales bacterium]
MTSAPPLASRCVLVLGMHRSGTSVLARALIALGVDFGSQLVESRADNPKGFFEDADANVMNDAFLEKIGCRWHSLRLPSEIPDEHVNHYRNEIRSTILEKFAATPFWGLKEPRITRLLPHWLAAMQETGIHPLHLLANRHPYSVAASLTRRDGLPVAQSLALWALHQLDGLEAIAEHGGLVVDYDLLMASPKQAVERLATFLGISPQLQKTEIDHFIDEFLQADLRHAQFTVHSEAATPLQTLCLELHRQILALAAIPGGTPPPLPASALDVMRETRARLEAMTEWMEAVDALHAEYSDQLARLHGEHAAQMANGDRERELRLKELHKTQAQLEWLESRLPIKLYQQLKARLQKSPDRR